MPERPHLIGGHHPVRGAAEKKATLGWNLGFQNERGDGTQHCCEFLTPEPLTAETLQLKGRGVLPGKGCEIDCRNPRDGAAQPLVQ